MPIIRSPYQIEQFEGVLQNLAHEFPKFHRVSTEDATLNFYYDDDGKPRRIAVQFYQKTGKMTKWGPEREFWSFTIEPKLYTTSEDSTKISYGYKEVEEKIRKFIEKSWRQRNLFHDLCCLNANHKFFFLHKA